MARRKRAPDESLRGLSKLFKTPAGITERIVSKEFLESLAAIKREEVAKLLRDDPELANRHLDDDFLLEMDRAQVPPSEASEKAFKHLMVCGGSSNSEGPCWQKMKAFGVDPQSLFDTYQKPTEQT